jgi:hypothetical protein
VNATRDRLPNTVQTLELLREYHALRDARDRLAQQRDDLDAEWEALGIRQREIRRELLGRRKQATWTADAS